MSDTPEFVDGLIVKAPHERAPDFVKCQISIKRKDNSKPNAKKTRRFQSSNFMFTFFKSKRRKYRKGLDKIICSCGHPKKNCLAPN